MTLDIGRVGIWTFQLEGVPFSQGCEAVDELGELGFGAVWIPEAVGREALSHSALLLSGTRDVVIATGIASMYARDGMTMAGGQKTIASAHPDRFLLGIGVSHAPMVEGVRKHDYSKPYSAMVEYLDAMDSAMFFALPPTSEPQRVLAALGPKMLGLARDRAAGAHPYFIPVEHTQLAREVLGEGPLLAPEQAVILETDTDKARTIARTHMATYLTLPNYTNNLRRLGWTDDDLGGGGSDRLVDAIVAWGTIDDVKRRVQAHHDAGADHVCLQVLAENQFALPQAEWREIAAALL